MKALKKVLALCLAAILLLALSPAAFADGETAIINVTNALKGEIYTVYRIFDVSGVITGDDGEITNVAYVANSEWVSAIPELKNSNGEVYITLDSNNAPEDITKLQADPAGFAAAAIKYANDHSSSFTNSKKSIKATGTTVSFTGLPLGYYLLDSTVGSLCSLDTAYQTVTINDKNEVPTVDKLVKEGDSYGTTSTAKIGDTVEFKSVITLKKGTENLVFHDKMEDGLTLNVGSITVTCSDTRKPCAGKYDVKITGLVHSDCTFEIEFADNDYITSLAENTTLTVTYTAILNDKVDVENGENNTAWLKYGEASKTEDHSTKTKTLAFDLVKWHAGANNTKPLLADVKFKLYEDAQGTKEIQVVKVEGQENTYRVALTNETGVEIETVASGVTTIYGLDNKTYYLKETFAPGGFNKLTGLVKVDLTGGNNLKATKAGTEWDGNATGGVIVENKAGTTLPSTGGMGTTLFYVVGGLLMVCAVVLLVTKKRMEKNA